MREKDSGLLTAINNVNEMWTKTGHSIRKIDNYNGPIAKYRNVDVNSYGHTKDEYDSVVATVHNTLRQYHLHNMIAAAAEDLNDHKTAEHHWHQASLAHSHAHAVHTNNIGNDNGKDFTDMKRAAKEEAHKTVADKLL